MASQPPICDVCGRVCAREHIRCCAFFRMIVESKKPVIGSRPRFDAPNEADFYVHLQCSVRAFPEDGSEPDICKECSKRIKHLIGKKLMEE